MIRLELGVEQAVASGWEFTGPVWLWRPKTTDGSPKASPVAWHFLTIDGVVADGITYTVRQVLRLPPDGALLRLILARA